MPATVHFNPALTQGGLVLGASRVSTQLTGLVEVSVDYICRTADLPAQLEKFFIDAPPPIFPAKTIAPANLAEGKLFMINYGVNQQYGHATISARYAGVTSKPIKPFKSFDYSDFAAAARVYVSLTGFFGGSMEVLAFNEASNDFDFNHAFTVGFRGRLETIKYTWASLDTASSAPSVLPPRPSGGDAFAEIELIPGAININDDFNGRFGDVFTEANILILVNGEPVPPPEPPLVPAGDVADYAARTINFDDRRGFRSLTVDDWLARGVRPQLFFNTSRRTQAITPSVYVREVAYRPFVR